MEFRIGDIVIIECRKSSLFHKYNGCVCTVVDVERGKAGDYIRVSGADNGWWPVSYVKRHEPDEEIDAKDLSSIM